MIWFSIWYILMGVVGSDFLAGIIIGIRTLRRGYYYDYESIINCASELGEKRREECALSKLGDKSNIMALIYIVFEVITWPVDFLRIIFCDYQDAIELYESRHDHREEAQSSSFFSRKE